MPFGHGDEAAKLLSEKIAVEGAPVSVPEAVQAAADVFAQVADLPAPVVDHAPGSKDAGSAISDNPK